MSLPLPHPALLRCTSLLLLCAIACNQAPRRDEGAPPATPSATPAPAPTRRVPTPTVAEAPRASAPKVVEQKLVAAAPGEPLAPPPTEAVGDLSRRESEGTELRPALGVETLPPSQAGGPPAATPPAPMPPAVGAQAGTGRPTLAPLDPALVTAIAQAASRDALAPVLKAFYGKRAGAPAFVDGLTPSPAAHELLALVQDLPSHAVDAAPYALEDLAIDNPLADIDAAARLEVRLASALVRYVADFRYLRRIHPFKSVALEDRAAFFKKSSDDIAELANRSVPSVRQSLEALWPARPEYAVLRAALPIWKQKAEDEKSRGRPPIVPIKNIDPDATGKTLKSQAKTVRALQERLRFDGYLTTDATGVLDEPTRAAVAAFQHRHNLTEDGRPGLDTLKRFRETNATKVHQIELSLQRWREAEILRDAPVDYLRVNLPAFQLEIIEHGTRTRSHRVIVGNSKLDFNQDDWKQGFINRTPFLETRLYKLILNPTWIVPTRIRDGEILVESAKDPGYLKKQGIHVRSMSDGSEKYVQSAGDHNVLGQVKFLLEKTDAVYLHDTNKRKFFAKSERALSHGCMRVDKAMDLAHYIASTRSNHSAERVDSIVETGNTTELVLERPLPVYTDYNTVGLDDAGDLVFYLDVYGYDRAALSNSLPPATYTRFGSGALKPAGVPIIPAADYQKLKAQGPAPMRWPPSAAAPGAAAPSEGP